MILHLFDPKLITKNKKEYLIQKLKQLEKIKEKTEKLLLDYQNVSAVDAWNELSSFKGIENYSPIASSIVEGVGVGSKRTCTMPDGAEINEVLNKLDHDKMHFEYEILTGPFPISNYISDVHINSLENDNCEINWRCKFDVDPEAEAEMKNLFEGFYNDHK